MVVSAALQEDVDAIGLSIMSGAHLTLFPAIMSLLKAQGGTDIRVFGGGIIPEEDIRTLKKQGVSEIFTPGASTQAVIEWIRTNLEHRVSS